MDNEANPPQLTKYEAQVFSALAKGYSDEQICEQLKIPLLELRLIFCDIAEKFDTNNVNVLRAIAQERAG